MYCSLILDYTLKHAVWDMWSSVSILWPNLKIYILYQVQHSPILYIIVNFVSFVSSTISHTCELITKLILLLHLGYCSVFNYHKLYTWRTWRRTQHTRCCNATFEWVNSVSISPLLDLFTEHCHIAFVNIIKTCWKYFNDNHLKLQNLALQLSSPDYP